MQLPRSMLIFEVTQASRRTDMGDSKREALTRDQRRLLGVAISMAHADAVIEDSEREFIATLTKELKLVGEAKAEVERMMREPPSPSDIAGWCVTDRDRLDIYAVALQMAEADERVVDEETEMLGQLASVLGLSDDDVKQAAVLASGAAS